MGNEPLELFDLEYKLGYKKSMPNSDHYSYWKTYGKYHVWFNWYFHSKIEAQYLYGHVMRSMDEDVPDFKMISGACLVENVEEQVRIIEEWISGQV